MTTFDKLINEQLAKNVVDTTKLDSNMTDVEMLRLAIQAELDAVSLYEQMAETTDNEKLKETFLDVAKEEKVHIGEFGTHLKQLDPEQSEAGKQGKDEVEGEE